METFRQVVTVGSDRCVEMTLPAPIPPEQMEIGAVQPIGEPAHPLHHLRQPVLQQFITLEFAFDFGGELSFEIGSVVKHNLLL